MRHGAEDSHVPGSVWRQALPTCPTRPTCPTGLNSHQIELFVMQMLKDNEYVRVWFNKGGNHYLIYFPTGSKA